MGEAFITRRGGGSGGNFEAIFGVTSSYTNSFRLDYDATKTYIVTAYFSNNGTDTRPNEMATWLVDKGVVTPLGFAGLSEGFLPNQTPRFTCVITDVMTISNTSSAYRHMGVMIVEVS